MFAVHSHYARMSKRNISPPPLPARRLLADNMRRLRAARGWTQEDLAFECELDRSFLGHVERGARNISLDNLEKIARALGVPIAELLMVNSPEPQQK